MMILIIVLFVEIIRKIVVLDKFIGKKKQALSYSTKHCIDWKWDLFPFFVSIPILFGDSSIAFATLHTNVCRVNLSIALLHRALRLSAARVLRCRSCRNEQRNKSVKPHARTTGLVAARNLRRILKGENTGKAGSDVRDQQNDGWVQNADFSGCLKTHARNRI